MLVECIGGPRDGEFLSFSETLDNGALVGIESHAEGHEEPALYRFVKSSTFSQFIYIGDDEELGGDR